MTDQDKDKKAEKEDRNASDRQGGEGTPEPEHPPQMFGQFIDPNKQAIKPK